MRRWMSSVNRNLLLHCNMLDAVPLSGIADDPLAQLTVLAPPSLVKFSVIGTDGQFQVIITLPRDINPPTVSLLQNKVIGDSNQLGISMVHPGRPRFRLEFDSSGKLTRKQYIGDFTVYAVQLDRSHTFLAGREGVIDGASSTHTIQYAGGGFVQVFEIVPGETFALKGGAVGSHNYRKVQ